MEFLKGTKFSSLEFMDESFDTSLEIEHVSRGGNVAFYYVQTQKGEKYRIFVETIQRDVHVSFEYADLTRMDYVTKGTNKLNMKELLSLLGTIKNILKEINPKSVFIKVDEDSALSEQKKLRLYRALMERLAKELNLEFVSYNENSGENTISSKLETPKKSSFKTRFKS